MKKILIAYYFIFIVFAVQAQNQHDKNWVVKSGGNHALMMSWNNDTIISKLILQNPAILGSYLSVISNKQGELRYYSNGCSIMGRDNKILPHGDTINPGIVWLSNCKRVSGYPSRENVLLLPMPDDTSRYFAFHTRSVAQDSFMFPDPQTELFYSEINSQLNDGIGDVVKKNILIKSDTFHLGIYTCRHANGKDWWIILPKLTSLGFHRILLSSKGVQYVGEQIIKKDITFIDDRINRGQGNFSHDGKKFAFGNAQSGIFILDFDRCSGLFATKYDRISKGFFFSSELYTGLEFSPNNRFLYLALGNDFWQCDLKNPDIVQRLKYIGDNPKSSSEGFYQCQLAPDNKIYIGSINKNSYLSIIHNPDSLGEACNFKPHFLKLKVSYESLPNMPSYRLGASDPNCKTSIATNDVAKRELLEINVFPNPTSGYINITSEELPNMLYTFALFDTQGKQVFLQQLQNGKTSLELPPHLPQGIYFWYVLDGVKQLQQGKLLLLE
jgi:hypothetical protein